MPLFAPSRLLLAASLCLVPSAVAQTKPSIPDFPGSTTSTPATTTPQTAPAASTPPPVVTPDPAQATQPSEAQAAGQTTTTTVPAKNSKAAEKAAREKEKADRKAQKEEDKKKKEADREAKSLKLQGGDIVAPTLDADGQAVTLESCSKKDKECKKKRKEVMKKKNVGMKLTNGTLTVDGWTGKARLSYDISEVKFLYISAPGIGTAVIATQGFPGSVEQKSAFDGKNLSITTPDGHAMQLSSDKDLFVSKKPRSAWVAFDTNYTHEGKYPSFGYGSTARAPYNWPGGRPMNEEEKKVISKAPPLPKGLEAKEFVLPCVTPKPGESPKPVKINGMMMTPPVCPAKKAPADQPVTTP